MVFNLQKELKRVFDAPTCTILRLRNSHDNGQNLARLDFSFDQADPSAISEDSLGSDDKE